MFSIQLKPRAYRIREVLTSDSGFPVPRYQLQCQTRLGWNTLFTFINKPNADKALKEWKDTLP